MHHFIDFKGFAESKLNLLQPLTVLIGPNGSGKSNIIEGVELLAFIAQGRPLHEIADVGRGGASGLEIRGGLEACPTYGKTLFALAFSASLPFDGSRRNFTYAVSVLPSPDPRIATEHLFLHDDTMIFETTEGGRTAVSGDVPVRYNNFARGGKKPITHVAANRSVLSQYTQFARKHKRFDACVRLVHAVMHHLQSSFVFDPAPRLMRSYQRIGDRDLMRNGANISAVLYALEKGGTQDRKSRERLLNWIRQLPVEPYEDFDFVVVPRLNDVIFGLKESSQHLADARMLSDGTLRCLAVLTALETVRKGSRVIIEEFDNGLHPSRVRVLTEALADCCVRRRLNVLVTTHNPATLDALSREQLDGVVMCIWNKEIEAFDLVRLVDLPRFPELFERGRLGDLVTRRVVQEYLSPGFEGKREQEALKWLQELR